MADPSAVPSVKDKLFYFVTVDAQRRDFPAVAAAADPSSLFARPCVTAAHYASISTSNRTLVQICSNDELYTLTRNVMPYGCRTSPPSTPSIAASTISPACSGQSLAPPTTKMLSPKSTTSSTRTTASRSAITACAGVRPAGVQTEPVVERGIASFGFSGVKVDTLTARLASILGNHFINQLRYSWGRDFEDQLPQSPAPGEPVGPNGFAPSVAVLADSTGFTFGTPATMPQRALPDE